MRPFFFFLIGQVLLFTTTQGQSEVETYHKQILQQITAELGSLPIEWQIQFTNKTAHSRHERWIPFYDGIPFFNLFIQLHFDSTGQLISYEAELPDREACLVKHHVDYWKSNFAQQEQLQGMLHGPVKSIQVIWMDAEEKPCIRFDCVSREKDETIIFNVQNQQIYYADNRRFLFSDTVVHTRIFHPDPLTRLGLSYGAPYVDSNDAALSWFIPAYDSVFVPATWDATSLSILPEHDYARIVDFQTPNIAPLILNSSTSWADRSQGGFEDYNVLWHIANFHDHIASMGYDTLMNLQVEVDAHGMFGADNSVFNRNAGNPTLSFGTGGVDDAEDADVIIHEYCHGISWSANQNDNFTNERAALDEGLADYFATSYSRSINSFNWQNMFSWDGHNPYWSGRTAATSNNYPNASGIYGLGEIWNAALSAIWTDLGRTVTDKLMLESLHFYTNSTSLTQAAYYLLQCDTLLFGGIHTNTLCLHLSAKNLLGTNCRPLGLQDAINYSSPHVLEVYNELGFAQGTSPLHVRNNSNEWVTLQLLNTLGQIVQRIFIQPRQELHLDPGDLKAGIYFLQSEGQTKKLIRCN